MGLTNVTGVLSRYFIVGFFLPTFAALVFYSQTATHQLLPAVYEGYSPATQIAILGGTALLLGLTLLGLNYPIMRAFEGYPLLKMARWLNAPGRGHVWRLLGRGPAHVVARLVDAQASRRANLREARDGAADERIRAVAAWRLDSQYPRRRADLLPTSFGNTIRAFELHSSHRWGLDAIAAQPRISLLLSEDEHEAEADARSEAAFFVNLSFFSVLLAAILLVDLAAFRAGTWDQILAPSIPLLAAWAFYHASIGAAERWGNTVRAAIDLHRLELYTKIGVTTPATFEEERTIIGPAISRCFLYGTRLPDQLRAKPAPPVEDKI
jgi:hypothetical protein